METACRAKPPEVLSSSAERRESSGLSVVIVSFNSGDVLGGLLDSLPAALEESGADIEIIVADNDSRDQTCEIALVHATRPRLIRMGRNAGYSAGINAAASLAGPGRDLLILNPDIRLMPGSIAILRRRLARTGVGIVAPRIMEANGELALSVRREPSLATGWSDTIFGTRIAARLRLGEIVCDKPLYREGGAIDWATGAALLISAEARAVVGEWDESFFLYSEEVDYQRRVREAGLCIAYAPEAQVVHIGGAYQNNPFLSALMTTNRIGYFRRHHGALATALFRLSIIAGETVRAGLGRGHRAALRAALTPA